MTFSARPPWLLCYHALDITAPAHVLKALEYPPVISAAPSGGIRGGGRGGRQGGRAARRRLVFFVAVVLGGTPGGRSPADPDAERRARRLCPLPRPPRVRRPVLWRPCLSLPPSSCGGRGVLSGAWSLGRGGSSVSVRGGLRNVEGDGCELATLFRCCCSERTTAGGARGGRTSRHRWTLDVAKLRNKAVQQCVRGTTSKSTRAWKFSGAYTLMRTTIGTLVPAVPHRKQNTHIPSQQTPPTNPSPRSSLFLARASALLRSSASSAARPRLLPSPAFAAWGTLPPPPPAAIARPALLPSRPRPACPGEAASGRGRLIPAPLKGHRGAAPPAPGEGLGAAPAAAAGEEELG